MSYIYLYFEMVSIIPTNLQIQQKNQCQHIILYIQMRIFRILKKQRVQNEDKYLIHWLGKHRQTSSWHTLSQIVSKHPQQVECLNSYDRQLKKTCKELFETYLKDNQFSAPLPQSKPKKQENSDNVNEQSMEESVAASQIGKKIKKRHLRIGTERFLTKAQGIIEKNKSIRSIPTAEFKLNIQTDAKNQANWVYGDKVVSILEKKIGESTYRIKWSDNNNGVVDQEDLIENESRKLCKFWRKRLFETNEKKQLKKQN